MEEQLQGGVAVEEVHKALAREERRHLLRTLSEESPLEIGEGEITGIAPDSERIRTQFHHIHLPILAEYGFISWDKKGEKVSQGPNFDAISEWLSSRENQDSTERSKVEY